MKDSPSSAKPWPLPMRMQRASARRRPHHQRYRSKVGDHRSQKNMYGMSEQQHHIPHDPSLYNEDIAVVPKEKRTWTTWNYIALWISMSLCIPTYMLASWLIQGGMNWWQAILTILLGNLIVLVPMVLNAHAGTKYGIPFPVYCRASFGTRGANVPALLRAFVGCGLSV